MHGDSPSIIQKHGGGGTARLNPITGTKGGTVALRGRLSQPFTPVGAADFEQTTRLWERPQNSISVLEE